MRTRRITEAVALSLILLAAAHTGAHASSFGLAYSFDQAHGTGASPGGLLAINGNLYGTTVSGPATTKCQCGTFFKVTPAGGETLLYTFRGGADSYPFSGLAQSLGHLYGTTTNGGEVFSLSLQGAETITYTPPKTKGSPVGVSGVSAPGGALIAVSGEGGNCPPREGLGTVFALNKGTSATRILHSFCGNTADGNGPNGPVVSVNGTIYGTTSQGGQYNSGTIFSISPSGTEAILYSFKPNGPMNSTVISPGPLSYVGGHLYGTYLSQAGDVLYTVDTAGNVTILHTFTSTEGSPVPGLVAAGTTLYGVSDYALYSLDAAGNFAIAHTFPSNPKSSAVLTNGIYPAATPVYLGGALYGTTSGGGANNDGAIYKYTP